MLKRRIWNWAEELDDSLSWCSGTDVGGRCLLLYKIRDSNIIEVFIDHKV